MLLQGIFNVLASVAFVAALPGPLRRQDTTVVTTTTPAVTIATDTATTDVTTTAPVTTTATETATATTEVTTSVSTAATDTATTSDTTPPESSTASPESSSTEASTSLTDSVISFTTTSVSSLPVSPPSTTLTTETPVSSTLTTEISKSITSVVTATSSITTTVSVSTSGTESGSASASSSASEASITSSASESGASSSASESGASSSVSESSASASVTESSVSASATGSGVSSSVSESGASSSVSESSTSSVSVASSSASGTESQTSTTLTTTVPVEPSSTISVSGTVTSSVPVVPSSVNATSSPTPTIITTASLSVSGSVTATIPIVITSTPASEAPSSTGSVFVSGTITTTIPVVVTSLPVPPPGSVPSSSTPIPPSSSVTTVSGITGTGTIGPGPTISASIAPSPTPVVGPAGGIGLNTTPQYRPQSEYDFQSLNLALQQEILELSLFQFGLDRFGLGDFQAAGLGPNDVALIQFLVAQELDHVQLLQNILSPNISQPCNYTFPEFTDVRAFIDYSQKITRVGESGTLGFLSHLDAQDVAQLLLQTVAVESRQQNIFRQLEGIFPLPSAFVPVITQNMQWTLLAPIISTCPVGNPNIEWQNYPALLIQNNPFWPDIPLDNTTAHAITENRTHVSFPGREVFLNWDTPGQQVGFNNSFTTNSSAGAPQFVAWISELNITFTPLNNINGASGSTEQPGGFVFDDGLFPVANDTMFILVTDAAPFVTPYNLSQIEPHIVAGPAIYQAG
ncbi:hypothetical protein DENSPDRAFT_60074 [Dentipellis sp. KUC8613]|nr:hypothetical protein DENSPDRAFT_60074 [Dentipellis sp. KUC8613]